MSWSFNGVGTPAALKRALDKQSDTLGSDPGGDPTKNLSRYEFDHAKAALGALLDAADQDAAVALNASGYASIDGAGVVTPKSVTVEIKQLGRLYE
jgi:hypothetical protein